MERVVAENGRLDIVVNAAGAMLNGPIEGASDIAEAIVYAVTPPRRVAMNELLIRPTTQS